MRTAPVADNRHTVPDYEDHRPPRVRADLRLRNGDNSALREQAARGAVACRRGMSGEAHAAVYSNGMPADRNAVIVCGASARHQLDIRNRDPVDRYRPVSVIRKRFIVPVDGRTAFFVDQAVLLQQRVVRARNGIRAA